MEVVELPGNDAPDSVSSQLPRRGGHGRPCLPDGALDQGRVPPTDQNQATGDQHLVVGEPPLADPVPKGQVFTSARGRVPSRALHLSYKLDGGTALDVSHNPCT